MNSNPEYVNMGEVEGIPHIELFDTVSQIIAEENLAYVNEHSQKVKPRKTLYTLVFKRLLDICISFVALLVSLPINLFIAVCTFFDVGIPIMFKQERVGKDGKPFTIIKFRNMTNAVNENGELLPPDQRVTKFGKFVRKSSLDELLNFWSIFKGDMSLIGPRPLPFDYNDYLSDRHKHRWDVRPGLECPFMIPVDKNVKITWAQQFENDVYYVEHVSLLLDIQLIIKLFGMIFNRSSSNMRGSAVRGSFLGYNKEGESINSQHVEYRYYAEALKRMGYEETGNAE